MRRGWWLGLGGLANAVHESVSVRGTLLGARVFGVALAVGLPGI